ncbi:MAG: DNA-binding response regulator [Epsilonproteobacteria bacterium]|nr:MAG: DNA-binding response regulator [Campylobacterota bacterium]
MNIETKQPKILIVEDEIIVALDIKSSMEQLGFFVTNTVISYDDALLSVEQNQPDVIIMDINLENSKDGIQTVIKIQEIKNIPIIYLTAFDDDETISRAIKTNPLAYLIKPFKTKELKSTILLGLYKINQKNNLQIDKNLKNIGYDYYFDEDKQMLFYKEQHIKLNQNEQKLLTLLIQANGDIVSFEQLEHTIWEDNSVSSSALRTLIYRLRSKLEYKLIETVPTIGCKIIV